MRFKSYEHFHLLTTTGRTDARQSLVHQKKACYALTLSFLLLKSLTLKYTLSKRMDLCELHRFHILCINTLLQKGSNLSHVTCWFPNQFIVHINIEGAQWHSGRVLNLRSRDRWFKPHWRLCVVSLSKSLYPLLSTDSTQETLTKY